MQFIRLFLFIFLFANFIAHGQDNSNWQTVEKTARGQEVHWYAWGGSDLYNGYMAWAASQVEKRYGVRVRHVKLSDTSEAVRQILAEKSARSDDNSDGDDRSGVIDVMWINGENFAAMKKNGLLFGPFAESLPNFAFIDPQENPATVTDFTIPTDGLEAPWGLAQLIFIYDSEFVQQPPNSPDAMLNYAKANPGRITYPAPPDFLGTTFLKQLLLSLTPANERAVFYAPPTDETFTAHTQLLWDYLQDLTPYLMRQGKAYPKSGQELLTLLDNRDIDMAFSFNVGAVAAAVEAGTLSPYARPYLWQGGSLANSHFLAIPYNAKSKEGAQILINFLMSPEAQARKSDPRHWGEPSVLSYGKLDAQGRAWFSAVPESDYVLPVNALGTTLAEPHPDWSVRLEAEWLKRFAN